MHGSSNDSYNAGRTFGVPWCRCEMPHAASSAMETRSRKPKGLWWRPQFTSRRATSPPPRFSYLSAQRSRGSEHVRDGQRPREFVRVFPQVRDACSLRFLLLPWVELVAELIEPSNRGARLPICGSAASAYTINKKFKTRTARDGSSSHKHLLVKNSSFHRLCFSQSFLHTTECFV